MTNREALLIKLQEAKESLEEIKENIIKGEKLAETLSDFGLYRFFCQGCGYDKAAAGECEKCAQRWLEEDK